MASLHSCPPPVFLIACRFSPAPRHAHRSTHPAAHPPPRYQPPADGPLLARRVAGTLGAGVALSAQARWTGGRGARTRGREERRHVLGLRVLAEGEAAAGTLRLGVAPVPGAEWRGRPWPSVR